jgi:hypothetical protein
MGGLIKNYTVAYKTFETGIFISEVKMVPYLIFHNMLFVSSKVTYLILHTCVYSVYTKICVKSRKFTA